MNDSGGERPDALSQAREYITEELPRARETALTMRRRACAARDEAARTRLAAKQQREALSSDVTPSGG